MRVCLADDVALDLHVHHDEVCTVEHIGHDATNKSGGEDNGVRFFHIKELLDGVLICQVQFLMAAAHQIVIAPLLEVVPYCRANQPVVAGYVNLAVFA